MLNRVSLLVLQTKKHNSMSIFFMVEFDLPRNFDPEFLALIPAQRLKVDELMMKGKIRSYSLSADRSKLWMIVYEESERKAKKIINELPLKDHMDYQIAALMFHHSMEAILSMSLN